MNILIVDDESAARKSIAYIIQSEFGNMCDVLTSPSAKNALKIADKKTIDLLITDICMDEINGIELSREIVKLHNNCKIIYVSAYDEKEYLKAAISMKALGYIEKPIDKSQITKIVGDFFADMENKNNKQDLYSNITNDARLVDVLIGVTEAVDAENLFNNSYLHGCTYFSVVCCTGEAVMNADTRNILIDSLSSHLYNEGIKFLFQPYKEFIIVTGSNSNIYIDLLKKCIQNVLEETNLKNRTIISIGAKKSKSEIINSYESAKAGINKGFYNGYGVYSLVNPESGSDDYNIFEITNTFSGILEKQNEEELLIYIDDVVNKVKLSGKLRRQKCIRLFESLVYQLNLYAENNNILLEHLIQMNLNTIFLFDEIIIQRKEIIKMLFKEKRNTDDIVALTKKYIAENYKRYDLSIKEIADSVHLSVNYLSTHFKKVCGITINAYLLEFRIEKAKNHLRLGKYNADEIGRLVGYNDCNYFYRLFKKQTGMTTKEYRKSVGR